MLDADGAHGGFVITHAIEAGLELRRNVSAAHRCKAFDLCDIGNRHDPGNDRRLHPTRPCPLDESEVVGMVEEQLCDDEVHTGAYLDNEVRQVGLEITTLDVPLRIASR